MKTPSASRSPALPPLAIGARIRAARRAHGWSQSELARRLKTTQSRVSEVERDQPCARLGPTQAIRWAAVLEIAPAGLAPRLAAAFAIAPVPTIVLRPHEEDAGVWTVIEAPGGGEWPGEIRDAELPVFLRATVARGVAITIA